MQCPKCNQPIENGSQFCGNCGAQLAAASPMPAAAAPASPAAPQPAPAMQAAPAAPAPAQPAMAAPAAPVAQSMPAAPVQTKSNTKAIIALILGIIGIPASLVPILGWPTGIAAVVLGALSRKDGKSGMGLAGLILGVITIVLATIWFFVALISLSNAGELDAVESFLFGF